ncbi:MAG: peptide chain release factor 2 [Oscillospiraceae bacterium]|jgi:peptide chain release factor 2|nr:peptide chain release factor 2 [Oscillospiraceae bacterium]
MIVYEELKLKADGFLPELKELKAALDIVGKQTEVSDLETLTVAPDFWNDSENAQKITQRIGSLKSAVETYTHLEKDTADLIEMIEFADSEEDESLLPEIRDSFTALSAELESQKLSVLLSGEYDSKNAILTFHAGAGGTEAQDWAEMLYRMYAMWADKHKFKKELLDWLDGDDAGMKSAKLLIKGTNAYGLLKSENGVHRLVRVSPFDASGRRHTSFAAVEVMPELDPLDTKNIDIPDDDLTMEVYRASGAGGQKVNKTSSAVRLIHKPTGLVAACQTQRSQPQNREYALQMIKSQLAVIMQQAHLSKLSDLKGVQHKIEWGSQIRSYVFMPYTLAKDHRTNFESGNIQAVMDGELDGFINAYLKGAALGNLILK